MGTAIVAAPPLPSSPSIDRWLAYASADLSGGSGSGGPRKAFQAFFDDIAAANDLESALLLTAMPSGRLQLSQAATLEGLSTDLTPDARLVAERIAWQAIVDDAAPGDIAAVRIPSPVFTGYPGALVLTALAGRRSTADAERLQQICHRYLQHHPDASARANQRTRHFVITASGQQIGPGADPAHPEAASTALRQLSNGRSPQRVLVPREDGGFEPATIAAVSNGGSPQQAVLIERDAAAILSIYPAAADWHRITPGHFSADEETSRLTKAVVYMASHFHAGPTLDDVADAVELSPFHFHRRFSERFGITPKHLLFELQIEKAKQMLADPAFGMAEIAKACGFAHQSHFTSRFKQGTAQTPSAWRRQALNR